MSWIPTLSWQNYLRYSAFFALYVLNVEENHLGDEGLLTEWTFSVFLPFTFGNKFVVNKTIEESFLKYAKSWSGGMSFSLSGINTNTKTYQWWVRTIPQGSQLLNKKLSMTQL